METKNYKNNSTKFGIYKITNLNNDKVYIGSTKSAFWSRKTKHINRLKKNIHHSKHLQNAWNLYGEKSFCFEIILIVDDPNIIEYLEFLFIKTYDTINPKFGYNTHYPNKYKAGFKQKNDTIFKKSEYKKKKAKNLSGLVSNERGLPKPISVFDLNGNFIESFKSGIDLIKKYGGSKAYLSTVLSNRNLFYKNKIVIFENDDLSGDDIKYVNKKHKKKSVLLYDLNNNLIRIFDTVKDCANFIKCKDAEIRMCCTGKRSRIRNYITEYK